MPSSLMRHLMREQRADKSLCYLNKSLCKLTVQRLGGPELSRVLNAHTGSALWSCPESWNLPTAKIIQIRVNITVLCSNNYFLSSLWSSDTCFTQASAPRCGPLSSHPHLTCRPRFPHWSPLLDQGPGFFIFSLSFVYWTVDAVVVWILSLSAPTVWNHTDAACTAGDWFQLQCITMGLHKKSLLQRDKNLIEFLKAEGWAFWIFPAYAAWRQQIKDGICGDYSQMACNEWLSFPLMVSKQQSKTTVWATFGSDSKLHY